MAEPHRSTPAWRAREREWAAIAATAVLLCLAFSLLPRADLDISTWFYDRNHGFVGNQQPVVMSVYWAVPWLGRAAALLALVVCLAGWRHAGRLGRPWWRRIGALGLVLLLGVGLLVNGGLKEHWGRARPKAVIDLGGSAPYAPALRPSDACDHNCSFVSGHAATGFAVMALGCLGAPRTRRRWLCAGLALGLLVGAGRVLQGGHFVSDVLFAGLAVWVTTAAVRQGWLLVRLHQRRRGLQRRNGHQPDTPDSRRGHAQLKACLDAEYRHFHGAPVHPARPAGPQTTGRGAGHRPLPASPSAGGRLGSP